MTRKFSVNGDLCENTDYYE